ncbi:three-Cys-motif partner protein TcmP [Deinococcus budaensis]|uniref:Three-Cys-motif partner protein n=1 Tax=Deinococcus budaensis TaxID=1665626 RepID=A0A7W8GFW0_9DEIO|nr:three-Cys-motif partner protein TcmP [Deinococcus budaensis]MBB5234503.1 three-Cys-motif partner protein [Deinococcus budaensis]
MTKDNTDPKRWMMKRQTEVKHQILEHYLKAYMAVQGRRQPTTFHFVDGFAGRGVYQGGEPGSPIIAMRTGEELYGFTNGNARLRVYAVELEPENYLSLSQEVTKARPQCPSIRINLYNKSFADQIDPILQAIPSGEPTFVFIDPFGYDGVDIDTVISILKRPRTESFATFMSSWINRFLSVDGKAALNDKVFGGPEWRDISEVKDEKTQEKVVRLYCTNLLKAAKEQGIHNLIVFPIGIKGDQNGSSIYHLVHLSTSPKARFEMETAVKRRATAVLKGVNLGTIEPLFFMMTQQDPTSDLVLDLLQSRGEMDALTVAGEIWQRRWEDNLTWDGEIRRVFQDLEREGRIEITRPGRIRKLGLVIEEKDRIRLKR